MAKNGDWSIASSKKRGFVFCSVTIAIPAELLSLVSARSTSGAYLLLLHVLF